MFDLVFRLLDDDQVIVKSKGLNIDFVLLICVWCAVLSVRKKKNDSQGKSESYVCSNLPVGVDSEETEKENSKVFDSAKVQDVETDGRNEDISCVNQFSPKIETHDVVPLHESENGSKQDEYDQKILKRRGNEDNEQGWSQNDISADSVSVTKEDVPQVASCSDGFNSLKDVTNVEAVKDTQKNKSESIVSNSSKLKRRRSFSESDTTNSDSVPCLRSRISKYKTVKKQRAVSNDESGDKRKAIALVDRTEDDNDFETPKVRRNTAKRKGSDLSDDQDLFSSAFSTDNETSSNVKPDAKGTINSKKRRTNQVEIKGKALSGKAANLARKRVTTRQAKTVNGTAVTDLEGKITDCCFSLPFLLGQGLNRALIFHGTPSLSPPRSCS